ncbi:hypothetical protein ANN_19367 [Periplaneta americana]|uniref:Histone-lysine N-methyltransferase SETMAR n=1 Tax=Periplaneta americana TaxID=6978 RepID=A0ABQ8SAM6_PERAM|nr:hypothetical protein ANN_19367 [Periplaneta americana]
MSPESSTEIYPAFAHIGLRENPEKTSTSRKCAPIDIHRRLKAVYRGQYVEISTVRRWSARARNEPGATLNLCDKGRSGRPCTATDYAHRNRDNEFNTANRRITQQHLSIQCSISRERVQVIIAELRFRKIWARWMPRMLLPHMKQKRLGICQQLLLRCEREGDESLKEHVTGDESWIHHFDPENKRTNSKGSSRYGEPLLQHDNSRPHTSAMTTEHIQRLGFDVVDNPSYSPDLAPLDFRLFPKLKEHLRGHLFNIDDAMQTEMRLWFRHQSETFYSDGLKKLVTRREKCIHR